MAESIDTIRAALEADPRYATLTRQENGAPVALSAEERDAVLDRWAAHEHQRQLDAEAEAAEETRRQQAKALYDALKAGTATNRQVQGVLAFLLRREFRDLAP